MAERIVQRPKRKAKDELHQALLEISDHSAQMIEFVEKIFKHLLRNQAASLQQDQYVSIFEGRSSSNVMAA